MATNVAQLSVQLTDMSKQFGREWIIKQLSYTFVPGHIYGISGRNGSGKSTLIRLLAAQLSPSRGTVHYELAGERLAPDDVFRQVSWTAPYIEIIEELTIAEQLSFHFALKPTLGGLSVTDILHRIDLYPYRKRSLLDCSSGMRQRVLLATGLYAATPLLLLDEPTVTLDKQAADWFYDQLAQVSTGRVCVIASNDSRDLAACTSLIEL
jgi:ABC-type multidrug transport system ATPase subunit